jgi:hypothetical protein
MGLEGGATLAGFIELVEVVVAVVAVGGTIAGCEGETNPSKTLDMG